MDSLSWRGNAEKTAENCPHGDHAQGTDHPQHHDAREDWLAGVLSHRFPSLTFKTVVTNECNGFEAAKFRLHCQTARAERPDTLLGCCIPMANDQLHGLSPQELHPIQLIPQRVTLGNFQLLFARTMALQQLLCCPDFYVERCIHTYLGGIRICTEEFHWTQRDLLYVRRDPDDVGHGPHHSLVYFVSRPKACKYLYCLNRTVVWVNLRHFFATTVSRYSTGLRRYGEN